MSKIAAFGIDADKTKAAEQFVKRKDLTPKGEKRRFTIDLDIDMHRMIKRAIIDLDIPMSEWVREAVIEKAAREKAA